IIIRFMESKLSVRESMFRFIEQWQTSGLSQLAFCKENNIRYHLFHYWYKQFRDAQEPTVPVPKGFIQLKSLARETAVFAELAFPNGNRISFHEPVSADYLKALIN
ncbi:MAG: IS66 family insertion sequence element accessory protein TnpA, partial [Ginsengibacter sp.]